MKIIKDIIQHRAEQKVSDAVSAAQSAVAPLLNPFFSEKQDQEVYSHLKRKLDAVLNEIEAAALPRFVRFEQQTAAEKFQAFLSQ